MTDFDLFTDDGALLSAYLHGQLDEAATRSLESRLQREPALARQLDALADALVVLSAADDAATPAGYEQRLAERLQAARDDAGVGVAPGADELAQRRRGRAGRRWSGLGAVAALLVGAALVGGTVLQTLTGGGADMAVESAGGSASRSTGQEGAAADGDGAAMEEQAAGADDSAAEAEGSLDGGSRPAGPPPAGPPGPVAVDAEVALRDDDDLVGRYGALVEQEGAIPTDPALLSELAERNARRIEQAEPFASAGPPASCVPAVVAGRGGAVVRVESAVWRGRPALAYVVAGEAGAPLARAVVVTPGSCARLAGVPLP